MEQLDLNNTPESRRISSLSREILEKKYEILEKDNEYLLKELYKLRNQNLTHEQLQLVSSERVKELEKQIFGSSSEKYKKSQKQKKPKTDPLPKVKKPSERYPNVPVRDVLITMDPVPSCDNCSERLKDTGMRESSERLTVIPKKYEIERQLKVIYGCTSCHEGILTAPGPMRIMDGSTYSDEMIMDVGLSKYCDLIPVSRYVAMAARGGVVGIPSQSLIECTHYLADFLISLYMAIKDNILSARVLRADETPHRMLEGSDKKSWYLWGFSTLTACYFEIHDTRSGDVSSEILKYAQCLFLLSDRYTGYDKSVRESNQYRMAHALALITAAYCNVHSRRYFFKSLDKYPEAAFYMDTYAEIYKLRDEGESQGKSLEEVRDSREKMRPFFKAMHDKACEQIPFFPEKGLMGKALSYFLTNYKGLTVCLDHPEVPLDNNVMESLQRSPVVGRKTWYGTHSEKGARTAAIMFTVVESCKMNQVNPREYLPFIVDRIKNKQSIILPHEFKQLHTGPPAPPGTS